MKKTENMSDYKADYNRNSYDRISLYIPKGERDEIKKVSDSLRESLNAFIYRAIVEKMARLTKAEKEKTPDQSTEE